MLWHVACGIQCNTVGRVIISQLEGRPTGFNMELNSMYGVLSISMGCMKSTKTCGNVSRDQSRATSFPKPATDSANDMQELVTRESFSGK